MTAEVPGAASLDVQRNRRVSAPWRVVTAIGGVAGRHPFAAILVMGMVVFFPSVTCGYVLDDYVHAAMFHGNFPGHHGPFNLYDFIDDGDRAGLSARGLLPWWSDPGLTIRFWRPLSSALIWGDHWLLGDGPLPLHIHSFVWWAGAVYAAFRLFGRVLTPRARNFATVIFAIAPCHAVPLAWLANREALVSLTFGLGGLASLLDFLERGRRRDAGLAALLFSVSLLGGEYGLAIGAYVLTATISTRDRSFLRRVASLLVFGVPAGAYLAWRSALGYGTRGSGFYTDPLTEPVAFLRDAPQRFAILASDAWLTLGDDALVASTSPWLLGVLLAAVVGLLVVVFWKVTPRLAPSSKRNVKWLFAGSVLALAPVLAVVPSPRLLGAPMIGTAAVAAVAIDYAWFNDAAAESWAVTSSALLLAFAHLVHAPAISWLVGRGYKERSIIFTASAKDLASRLRDRGTSDVFVVRGGPASFFLPFALGDNFCPPEHWGILSQTGHVLEKRDGPHTIQLIAPMSRALYPRASGNLFRAPASRFAKGQEIAVVGARVTVVDTAVLDTGTACARIVRIDVDRDLESYAWVTEDNDGFNDAPPPAIGHGRPLDP